MIRKTDNALAAEVLLATVGDRGNVVDAIEALLVHPEFGPSALRAQRQYAENLIRTADKALTARAGDHPSLFADADGLVAVGPNERVRRGAMRKEDWKAHLGISDANRERVDASNDREHAEYELLEPWLDLGLDTDAAMAAYVDSIADTG